MPQIKIDEENKIIKVPILLTTTSGKIRVKNRSMINEYGVPVATRRDGFSQSNYIEWQIGYDVIKKETDKLAESSLPGTNFVGANGKEKALYELSEYIFWFYRWGIISEKDLAEIEKYLREIPEENLLDENRELQIDRSHPIAKTINDFEFDYAQVKYPLLIHKFGKYEIITEIKITEKQRAVGTQPMLYLCFPITELFAKKPLVGRVAEAKESADFAISRENISVFLKILKMFGILSKNHQHDVLEILRVIRDGQDLLC